jgi:hypothetical protein
MRKMNKYTSTPFTFTGDFENVVLVKPHRNNRLVIKNMTIFGDGSSGIVKVTRNSDGATVLPYYVGTKVGGRTPDTLNLVLGSGESLNASAKHRMGAETFIGITYLELSEDLEYLE